MYNRYKVRLKDRHSFALDVHNEKVQMFQPHSVRTHVRTCHRCQRNGRQKSEVKTIQLLTKLCYSVPHLNGNYGKNYGKKNGNYFWSIQWNVAKSG